MREIEILYYVDGRGRAPFVDWLEALKDRHARAKIKLRLDRLMRGLFGETRPVGSGVEELKVDSGPGYRVYYGRIGSKIVILLCGGSKGRQRRDIARAKLCLSRYLEACHGKT